VLLDNPEGLRSRLGGLRRESTNDDRAAALKGILRLFLATFRSFREDKAQRLGAALAYSTIFSIRTIDVLDVTARVVRQFGAESLVDSMKDPMPGSDPTSELGSMWTNAVTASVREAAGRGGRPVVVSAARASSSLKDALNTVWEVEPKPGRGFRAFVRSISSRCRSWSRPASSSSSAWG
jgi:membrane protein